MSTFFRQQIEAYCLIFAYLIEDISNLVMSNGNEMCDAGSQFVSDHFMNNIYYFTVIISFI